MTVFRLIAFTLLAVASLAAAASAQGPRRTAAAGAPPQAAPGQIPGISIAAVVNDEVISVFDLISRMRLVMASSNIPDTPETRQRLSGQVLRSLIDEKLELQEAKRQGVVATDEEVSRAVQQIEKQNNMRPGQLEGFLKERHIDRDSLISQIRASIEWGKLVRRLAAQSTTISDEEVDEAMKRLKEHANEPQSRVAEIFLAVDNPSQDEEVRRLAERLSQQMRQGARFSAVAQQFSQSATAAVGGDIGWVRPDQLAPELAKAVTTLKPGDLSPPIRTGAGYYLMLVLDRRNGSGTSEQETVYDIVQVVFPVTGTSAEARRNAIVQAEGVRSAAQNCADMRRLGKERAPQLSSEGQLRASAISPELRTLIGKLGTGQASQPIVQKNGVGVIMVCGQSTTGGNAITREEVTESLIRQRLDTIARRYLRDLRRDAYVDVRA